MIFGKFGKKSHILLVPQDDEANILARPKPRIYGWIRCGWKRILAIFLPVLLLPMVFASNSKASECAFVLVLMAMYYMLEPVPLTVTSFLPIITFPLFGIMNSSQVAACYMKEATLFAVGSLISGASLEQTDIPNRLSVRVLLLMGTSIRRIMLAVIMTAMFLSMWISNISSIMILIPVIDRILEHRRVASNSQWMEAALEGLVDQGSGGESYEMVDQAKDVANSRNPCSRKHPTSLKTILLLCLAYGCTIGGIATPNGSIMPRLYTTLIEEIFPKSPEITFSSWTLYCLPMSILCAFLAWGMLQLLYRKQMREESVKNSPDIRAFLLNEYGSSEPIKTKDKVIVFLCLMQIILCVLRSLPGDYGWANFFTQEVKDSVPVMLIALLLFLLPQKLSTRGCWTSLVNWEIARASVPWDLVFVAGGGFALSAATKVSGFNQVVADFFTVFETLPPWLVCAFFSIFAGFITEIVSNAGALMMLVPVVSQIATVMHVHPIYLTLPLAVTVNYSFMLPVASPSNTILCARGNVKARDMLLPGFIMNVTCMVIQLIMINSVGVWMFGLSEYPDWANKS